MIETPSNDSQLNKEYKMVCIDSESFCTFHCFPFLPKDVSQITIYFSIVWANLFYYYHIITSIPFFFIRNLISDKLVYGGNKSSWRIWQIEKERLRARDI